MESFPQVLQPLLFYILQRISAVVYDPALRTTPKQLFADECWNFLSNETARAYLVAAGKTLRKHNAGSCWSRSRLTTCAPPAFSTWCTRFARPRSCLLRPARIWRSTGASSDSTKKKPTCMPGSSPKRQFLLKTDSRAKVLNVDLDPRALIEYGNSPYENARREAAIAAHGFPAGIDLLAAQTTVRQAV